MLFLGLVLLLLGGYCLLHPHAIPLNICHSRDVVFLQHLNVVLSFLVFVGVASMGGLFVCMVGHSVRKGWNMETEHAPIDYCEMRKTVLAYLLMALAIGMAIFVGQRLLKGTNLDPNGDPSERGRTSRSET